MDGGGPGAPWATGAGIAAVVVIVIYYYYCYFYYSCSSPFANGSREPGRRNGGMLGPPKAAPRKLRGGTSGGGGGGARRARAAGQSGRGPGDTGGTRGCPLRDRFRPALAAAPRSPRAVPCPHGAQPPPSPWNSFSVGFSEVPLPAALGGTRRRCLPVRSPFAELREGPFNQFHRSRGKEKSRSGAQSRCRDRDRDTQGLPHDRFRVAGSVLWPRNPLI